MASHDPQTALERLLRDGTDADLTRFLRLLQPPEIADLIESLSDESDRARAFQAILGRDKARVLRDLEEAERADIVEQLPPGETADLLEEMKSDDAADVLQEMDDAQAQAVLEQIEPEDRAEIEKVLEYPHDSAGGIMQTELVQVRMGETVGRLRQEIRRTRDEVGELHEVFVVDDEGVLQGWIKPRALVLAEDETRVGTLSEPIPVRVPVSMDQEEAAALVKDYDLTSVPVVDDRDRLVGRILVDDIVDVFEEEATEDIVRLAGSNPEEIYEPSVLVALRARAPWLVITFVGGIIAAIIINAGDDLVKQAGALFAFIPVIMGMGGGCATQTATVTVRGLALGRIDGQNVLSVIRKELFVGLIMATGTGVLLWVVAVAFDGNVEVAWIASLALFGTICLGTLFGALTPLIFSKLGVDPAVATSPFVTTMNDVLGSSLILVLCWMVFLS